jgi:hypothetical protein
MQESEPTDLGGVGEVRPKDAAKAKTPKDDKPPAPPADEKPAEEAKPDDGRKTPEEWANVCGHVNAKTREGAIRPMSASRAFIFEAVKAHCGWGVQRAIDERLTQAEYEEAVAEAMGTVLAPIGEPPALKWRHDARAARELGGTQ